MAIKTGDAVGDYRVIDLAGSGGMGTVYKIEHVITKRIEAMKVLPAGIGNGPEEEQRFEREIQVQARLHHPNIAALYNAVRADGSIALIMEYVEGESLQCMLERGPLPPHTAANYAGQVLDALAYAHHKGVVHRDVAPANIIITPEGNAKLTDFGLARAATDLRLTTTGAAMGSPWYMSPEQVRAVEQLDGRTDIYAMGAVLYEMLTGRKLFDVEGFFAVMRAQMEAVPQPPSVFNPQVTTALDEVVARALAKDPAARFQTAGEFRLALEAAIGGMRPSAATSNDTEPSSRRSRFRPSRGSIALAVACAGLIAVFCTVLLWLRTARVAAHEPVAREAVVSTPAPVTAPPTLAAEPAPPDPANLVRMPEAPVVAAKPAPQLPAAPAPLRPTAKQRVARSSVEVTEPPSSTPPPTPPRDLPAPVRDTPSKPDAAAALEAPPVPAVSTASDGLEATTQTPVEVKPNKGGNRFTRILGKLNPFRKGSKSDSAKPAEGQ